MQPRSTLTGAWLLWRLNMHAETLNQFLDRLHQGGEWVFLWTKEGLRSYWYEVGEQRPKPNGAARNVYFGIHPCYDVPPKSKTGNTDRRYIRSQLEYIGVVNGLYSEFDGKDFDGGKPAARAHVESLEPAPSVVIDSGGGYHCYWFLDDTWVLSNDDDRQRARSLQKAWVTFTGGDQGAEDLPRVLRLPGSKNHKYTPPRPVEFEHCDLTVSYPLEALETAVSGILDDSATKKPSTPQKTPPGASGGPYTLADDIAQAEKNLNRLSQARCDNRDDWIAVGMSLCELGDEGLRMWREWSQNSAKFKPGECDALWEGFTPGGGRTLATLGQMAKEDDPRPEPTDTQRDLVEPPREDPADIGADITARKRTTANKAEGEPRRYRKPKLTTADYIALFRKWGYELRLNLCNDDIEIDGEPLSDVQEDQLMAKVRDHGINSGLGINTKHAREAVTTTAASKAYHPVKQYLEALRWDDQDHIGALCEYFQDTAGSEGRFRQWFGHWIVGAVAKVYEPWQSPMLVIDGPQEVGKSYFARWLCPLDRAFYAGAIYPENKDCKLRQMEVWIWEVEELGATTRRQDVEALKAFQTMQIVRDRKAYGHRDIIKPALTSFVGTINCDAGFLVDRTGNRRFLVCSLDKIDWRYADNVNCDQLWAQAYAIYRQGEAWKLTEAERTERDKANLEYMIDDPVEAFLTEVLEFTRDPSDFVTLPQLLGILRDRCTVGQRSQSMTIASVLKGRGATKKRTVIEGRQQTVYYGVKLA
jgi:predicted P-loop ATPase